MLPEWRFNQIAKIKMLINRFFKKTQTQKNQIEIIKQLFVAVDDIVDFYNIEKKDFFDFIQNWEITEKKLFENAKNLKEFYESWKGHSALENVCANVFNQLIQFENYTVCSRFTIKSKEIIDYGCGTGALSIALSLNRKISGRLILLDVPNDVQIFLKFRIQKHKLTNADVKNIFTFSEKEVADLIICIDVLEHIENSSEVFIDKIYPLLKKDGYLILRAPWRGQITHIDKAADDFYLNGGRKFLSKKFKEIFRWGAYDICAVYRKI